MFTKEQVIDKDKIAQAINEKNLLTFERLEETILKKYQILTDKLTEGGITNNNIEELDANIFEIYLLSFSSIINELTLDELVFIRNFNLFAFEENNLLDRRCQDILDGTIAMYNYILQNLNSSLSIGNMGKYFHQFGTLFQQVVQASKLNTILGLDREGVELTPLGIKLKTCIDNINNLFHNYYSEKSRKKSIFKRKLKNIKNIKKI